MPQDNLDAPQETDTTASDPLVPHHIANDTHTGVLDLVGTHMEKEQPVLASLQPQHHASQPTQTRATTHERNEQEKRSHMNILVDRIQQLAQRLKAESLEHRARNLIDRIPIYSNIRSFNRATKEGELIQEMKQVMMELRFLVERSDSPPHIEDVRTLHEAIDALTIPGGLTKVIASVLPSARILHRDLTTPRTEAVQDKASALGRKLAKKEYQALAA